MKDSEPKLVEMRTRRVSQGLSDNGCLLGKVVRYPNYIFLFLFSFGLVSMV